MVQTQDLLISQLQPPPLHLSRLAWSKNVDLLVKEVHSNELFTLLRKSVPQVSIRLVERCFSFKWQVARQR